MTTKSSGSGVELLQNYVEVLESYGNLLVLIGSHFHARL